MKYTHEDAITLHHSIKNTLIEHGPERAYALLCRLDPELLAVALTLHTMKSVPHLTAE